MLISTTSTLTRPETMTSLASKAGVLASTELKIPSIFQAPTAPIISRTIAPYVTFAHTKRSDEWAKLVAKFGNPSEGDMFLIEQDLITQLTVLKAGWLCHQQYWVEKNPAGEMLRSSFEERPFPYKEQIEAVILVYQPDRVVPANICFRTTKCPAAKVMGDTLAAASTQEWGDKSASHMETLVCTQPFMRFYGDIQLGPQRTSKKTGLPYRSTVCSIHPTGVSEWRVLKEFCDSEQSQKQLQDAADRFTSQVAEVKSKAR